MAVAAPLKKKKSFFRSMFSGHAIGSSMIGGAKGFLTGGYAGMAVGATQAGLKAAREDQAKSQAEADQANTLDAASVNPTNELERRGGMFGATIRTMAAHPEIYGANIKELLAGYGYLPGPMKEENFKYVAPPPTAVGEGTGGALAGQGADLLGKAYDIYSARNSGGSSSSNIGNYSGLRVTPETDPNVYHPR